MSLNNKSIFEPCRYSDGEYRFGFRLKDGSLKFILPKFLMPSKEISFHDSLKLISTYSRVIIKYNNLIREKSSEKSIKGKSDCVGNALCGYSLLMNDYYENGDYSVIERESSRRSGRVNWKKTISSNDVSIYDGRVIYTTMKNEKTIRNKNADFYKLYRYTLDYSLAIFSGKKITQRNIEFTRGEIKSILDEFSNTNFSDRSVLIVELLKIIYLNASSYLTGKGISSGVYTDNIQCIWEVMVDSLINKSERLIESQTKMSIGSYVRLSDGKSIDGLTIEPDHVFYKNDDIYVLDSKFYSLYHNFENCKQPKSESINKQESYLTYLKEKHGKKNGYNFFIFPKNDQIGAFYEHFANHTSKSINSDIFLIRCVAIDFCRLSEIFVSSRNKSSLSEYLCSTVKQ